MITTLSPEFIHKYPTLVLAYPTVRGFSVFDTITCFKHSKSTDTKFTGQQIKQLTGVPKTDAPFDGLLLRSDANKRKSRPRKRKNWEYISGKDMQDFLPKSLHPLIPSEWMQKKD